MTFYYLGGVIVDKKMVKVFSINGFEFPDNVYFNFSDERKWIAVHQVMGPEVEGFPQFLDLIKFRKLMENRILELGYERPQCGFGYNGLLDILTETGVIKYYEAPLVVDFEFIEYPAHTANDYHYLEFKKEQRGKRPFQGGRVRSLRPEQQSRFKKSKNLRPDIYDYFYSETR
jgi:hypothetical protein